MNQQNENQPVEPEKSDETTSETSSVKSPEASQPSGFQRIRAILLVGFFNWIRPIRKERDSEDGRWKLVYTSFPKSFYFYLIWGPGFISLALNKANLVSTTSLVWTLMISLFMVYLVIAENFKLHEFITRVVIIALVVSLYQLGVIDFQWLQWGISKIEKLQLAFDPETVKVVTYGSFFYWCWIYVYSVTWRKRELSSNRRARLRPPLGKKIVPVIGRIVDNQLVDVLELFFGFGAYDVSISETSGREIDRDQNCVGLAFYVNFFGDLVGKIATSEAGVQAAFIASEGDSSEDAPG